MSIERKIHLEDDEEIIEIVKPNFLIYFWGYFFGILFILVSAYFLFWLLSHDWWGKAILGFNLLIAIFLILRSYILNSGNALIITTDRVIDINKEKLFSENTYSLNYHDIKDVVVEKKGFKSMLFKLGNIIIESKTGQFILDLNGISNPNRIQSLILKTKTENVHNRKVSSDEKIYKNFIKLIPKLDEVDLDEIQDQISAELEKREVGEIIEDVV